MNRKMNSATVVIILIVLGFIITACGVLEIEVEPELVTRVPTVPATQPSPLEEAGANADTPEVSVVTNTPPEATTEPTAEPTPAPLAEEGQDEEAVEGESVVSVTSMIDETWDRYTNYELGFSINIPRLKTNAFGACEWNEANGDHSYRPRYSLVPVKVFEDGNTVFITSEYQHVLSGETRETGEDGGTRIFYSECEAVQNSLALLRDPESYQEMWAIVVEEVQDDEGLEAFLKARYGQGCNLGEIIPSAQTGVFDVAIQGDGKDLSETACPINFRTVVKYYPEGGKVVAWNTGQAATFAADVNNEVTHDQEMIDSFRFLTGEEGS